MYLRISYVKSYVKCSKIIEIPLTNYHFVMLLLGIRFDQAIIRDMVGKSLHFMLYTTVTPTHIL